MVTALHDQPAGTHAAQRSAGTTSKQDHDQEPKSECETPTPCGYLQVTKYPPHACGDEPFVQRQIGKTRPSAPRVRG